MWGGVGGLYNESIVDRRLKQVPCQCWSGWCTRLVCLTCSAWSPLGWSWRASCIRQQNHPARLQDSGWTHTPPTYQCVWRQCGNHGIPRNDSPSSAGPQCCQNHLPVPGNERRPPASRQGWKREMFLPCEQVAPSGLRGRVLTLRNKCSKEMGPVEHPNYQDVCYFFL